MIQIQTLNQSITALSAWSRFLIAKVVRSGLNASVAVIGLMQRARTMKNVTFVTTASQTRTLYQLAV